MQPKSGDEFHPRLNTGERPIANKYRKEKMKRTLKKESKECLKLSGWKWIGAGSTGAWTSVDWGAAKAQSPRLLQAASASCFGICTLRTLGCALPIRPVLLLESYAYCYPTQFSLFNLLEAIDYMLEGFQNLVIPIHNYTSTKSEENLVQKSSSPKSYCWLTQEDVARFLLNSVGVFSPTRTFSIESLNIIDRKFMTVGYHDPAISALDLITLAHTEQTSVAVVDDDRRLIEEISGSKLAYCDEDVAAEIMTLSCGDLMAYINCGGPPEDLIGLVRTRLQEKKLGLMMELMDEESPVPSTSSSASCCSSDDESRLSRNGSSGRSSARRSEAITCYPGSSLAAVLILKHLHIVRVPFGSSMRMITI
ncbi:hypothetical protein T459_31665 [Capsicum annuum]|uniref:CBS domain-containing protein CBSX5-like n=1 Tax=Capsicum annuum TaxID=4072 RepID=A0A2G2Y4L7_CAPAN|nr:hypothetical protein T459_31665 [Capsicum annuum]